MNTPGSPEPAGTVGEHPRRWHLMAQLTNALDAWDGDYQKLTSTAAALIAEELGGRISVLLVDPPGIVGPVSGSSHPDRDAPAEAQRLYDELRLQIAPRYDAENGISDAAYAPLRNRSGELRGVVVCIRDAGSPPVDPLERTALTSAADTIGLGLELAVARVHERKAAAQAQVFAILAQSSPDFVAIASTDGVLNFVNNAGRRLIGMPDDVDVTRTKASDYYTAAARPIHKPFRDWPQSTQPRWDGVSSLRDWRDNSEIPVSVRSFPVYDERTGERFAVATVQRDIREELATQRALAELAEQRRVLLGELVTAEQAERGRIAQEVHDDSLQLLAAGQLRLQLLEIQLKSGNLEAATRAAADVSSLVRSAQSTLRRLLLDLEPPVSDSRQLHHALIDTARSFFADTNTWVTISGALPTVPDDVAAVFYRSGREAISNARRHAQASHVTLTLLEDETCWQLLVSDDGVGLREPIANKAGHLGLRGMISRAEALAGSCTIRAGANGGTDVQISIPKAKRNPAQLG